MHTCELQGTGERDSDILDKSLPWFRVIIVRLSFTGRWVKVDMQQVPKPYFE